MTSPGTPRTRAGRRDARRAHRSRWRRSPRAAPAGASPRRSAHRRRAAAASPAGRRLAAVPRRRRATAAWPRTSLRPRPRTGLDPPRPGAILTGSPAVVDGVATSAAARRERPGPQRRARRRPEDRQAAVDRARRRRCTARPRSPTAWCSSPRSTARCTPSTRQTGKQRWQREPEPGQPPYSQRSYSYYSPAVADGKVYWPYQTRYGKASRGLLAALDPRTGNAIWESPMTGCDDERRHAGRRRRQGLRRQRDRRSGHRL